MLIENRYQTCNKLEEFRKEKGLITFQKILNNIEASNLLPYLKKCKHSNTPLIITGEIGEQIINLECCKINKIIKGTKANATLIWNCSNLVNQDYNERLHPLININIYDSLDEINKEISILNDKIKEIRKNKLSRQEKKLLNLIISWNEYSITSKRNFLDFQNNEETKIEIPLMLVKTWLSCEKDENPEVYLRAKYMLKTKIGNRNQIEKYKQKHNLK